jgi:acyl-CoA thioesterase-2
MSTAPQQVTDRDLAHNLPGLMRVEYLEDNLYRGEALDYGGGHLFGGHVLGQSLAAAAATVSPERSTHSLHAYFLRPGKVNRPILYEVDRIRDGKSFATRRVNAIQGGEAIFTISASFQVQEHGYHHAATAPHVLGPDELPSEAERQEEALRELPEALRALVVRTRPVEVKPVDPVHPLHPEVAPPHHAFWFRFMPEPEVVNQSEAQAMLAYASDLGALGTAIRPHAVTYLSGQVQMASLDHALWFHAPIAVDDWFLYVVDSPWAGNARGLVQGQIFARDGQLIASVAQEGLIRPRPARTSSATSG